MGDPSAEKNQPAAYDVSAYDAAGYAAEQTGRRRMGQESVLSDFGEKVHRVFAVKLQNYAFFAETPARLRIFTY